MEKNSYREQYEKVKGLSWERVYVLSTQKKGDIFEDVYSSMEEAISYGKDALASKNGYTEAIAYALEEPDWENYKNGDITLGLGDLAKETIIITNEKGAE